MPPTPQKPYEKPYDPKAPENRFPKHLYHASHSPSTPNFKVVNTEAEEQDAKADGWLDAPPEVPTAPRADAETLAKDNAALKARLDELERGKKDKK